MQKTGLMPTSYFFNKQSQTNLDSDSPPSRERMSY